MEEFGTVNGQPALKICDITNNRIVCLVGHEDIFNYWKQKDVDSLIVDKTKFSGNGINYYEELIKELIDFFGEEKLLSDNFNIHDYIHEFYYAKINTLLTDLTNSESYYRGLKLYERLLNMSKLELIRNVNFLKSRK